MALICPGDVYKGQLETVATGRDAQFRTIMQWIDKYRALAVSATVFSAQDVSQAREYGSHGIGVCKTEATFLRHDRIDLFRHALLSGDSDEKAVCLKAVMDLQTRDFLDLFRAVDGQKVCIRLLDCPLRTFLPLPQDKDGSAETDCELLAGRLHLSLEEYVEKVEALQDADPALGCRGARLSIVRPEVTMMQIRAIVCECVMLDKLFMFNSLDSTGALILARDQFVSVFPSLLLPCVHSEHEAELLIAFVQSAVEAVCVENGVEDWTLRLQVGVQLDTPRAVLRAGAIAALRELDFVVIATGELTQSVHGISRVDKDKFLVSFPDPMLTWF